MYGSGGLPASCAGGADISFVETGHSCFGAAVALPLDGRIIHSAEIARIHKEVLDFKHVKAISDPMRKLIEDLWAGVGEQAAVEDAPLIAP